MNDFDVLVETARSRFGDMLLDCDRNRKYYAAIRKAVNAIHRKGKKAIVLDIGTGSGLLSMMAVLSGAEHVTACEAVSSISKCAHRIVKEHGLIDKIKIINKRSDMLTVGKGCDLEHKANLLVAELFDTELIGECALKIFNYAIENLVDRDCIVVPSHAIVYVQIAESDSLLAWNSLKSKSSQGINVDIPGSISTCSGTCDVHDLQLSQVSPDEFKLLTPSYPVFLFKWNRINEEHSHKVVKLEALSSGRTDVCFFWWDLVFDIEGDITLSCAPAWHFADKKDFHWRDHWIQGVYYLNNKLSIKSHQDLLLSSNHDEYSFWFSVGQTIDSLKLPRFYCTCGYHLFNSRLRTKYLNDDNLRSKQISTLIPKVTSDSNVLCIHANIFLAISAAKCGVKAVYFYLEEAESLDFLELMIMHNNIKNIKIIDDLSKIGHDVINIVLCEPCQKSSIYPWDNLKFMQTLNQNKNIMKKNFTVVPKVAVIKAIAVEFENLHKIKYPIGVVEEFNLSQFNFITKESSNLCDNLLEVHSLWEYPSLAVSKCVTVLEVDTAVDGTCEKQSIVSVESGTCNALVFWIDWRLDEKEESTVLMGPVEEIIIGKEISWFRNSQQGVLFLNETNIPEKIILNAVHNASNGFQLRLQ